MTTLAPPPPHLARLFNRLDAGDASDLLLRRALEFWREKRAGRLAPKASEFERAPAGIAAHAFVFQRAGAREWEATTAGSEAAILLGATGPDKRLSKLLARRIAARLRRLFETVAETAEPLAATFELRSKPNRQWIEVLAAPLSGDGRQIDGIYGGVVSRLERTGLSAS